MESSYPKIDYVMEREGLHRVCKYAAGKTQADPENPHTHEKRVRNHHILENITEAIGFTPMVRMQNIAKAEGLKCELRKFILTNAVSSCQMRVP